MDKLEDIIRQYVHLEYTTNQQGWLPVLCKVCNDHGKKGPRAAFKLDGDTMGYNCFNCKHTALVDPSKHKVFTNDALTVFKAFGIPDDIINKKQFELFSHLKIKKTNLKDAVDIEPKVIEIPDTFYYLKDSKKNDKWAEVARYYLKEERKIDPDSYPFMLSYKTDDIKLKKWFKRIIIPAFKNDNIIYYSGRSFADAKKKYENASIPSNKVLYGFDKLFVNNTSPLFITEGFFDSYWVNGVAILGNEISEAQKIWFNKSSRLKVYIPDKLGDGNIAAKQALEFGWSISTPDIPGCKDIDSAIKKYGKLYVLKTINDNIHSGFAARARLGLYCK